MKEYAWEHHGGMHQPLGLTVFRSRHQKLACAALQVAHKLDDNTWPNGPLMRELGVPERERTRLTASLTKATAWVKKACSKRCVSLT